MIKKVIAFLIASAVAAFTLCASVLASNGVLYDVDKIFEYSIDRLRIKHPDLKQENNHFVYEYQKDEFKGKGVVVIGVNENNEIGYQCYCIGNLSTNYGSSLYFLYGATGFGSEDDKNIQQYTINSSSVHSYVTLGEEIVHDNIISSNLTNISVYTYEIPDGLFSNYSQQNDEKIMKDGIENGEIKLNTNISISSATSGIIMTGWQSDEEKAAGGNLRIAPSWIPEGVRPYMSVKINDNGKNHSYGIRVSANTGFTKVLSEIMLKENAVVDSYNNMDSIRQAQQGQWWDIVLFTLNPVIYSGAQIASATYSSTMHGIYKSAYVEAIENVGSKMNDIEFDIIANNITSNNFTFTPQMPVVNTKVISIALDDYMNIQAASVLKIELIDNTSGAILDYTYILANRNYSINSTPYGQKIYDYLDDNSAMSDIENNEINNALRQYTDGLANSSGGGVIPYIKPEQVDNIFDDIGIQDLIGNLQEAVSGVGYFFQMCYSFFPPIYITILAMGAALLVILRVLGR